MIVSIFSVSSKLFSQIIGRLELVRQVVVLRVTPIDPLRATAIPATDSTYKTKDGGIEGWGLVSIPCIINDLVFSNLTNFFPHNPLADMYLKCRFPFASGYSIFTCDA
jgi:hypothetical protein